MRPVHLLKLERDTEGNQTEIAVPGADFVLYNNQDRKSCTNTNPLLRQIKRRKNHSFAFTGEYFFKKFDTLWFAPDLDSDNQPIRRYDFYHYNGFTTNDNPVVTIYNRRLSGDLIIEKPW